MGSTTKVNSRDLVISRCCTEILFPGRQYDGNGNVAEWWTPETVDNFGIEAQCYINQYDAFCYDDIGECVSYILPISGNQKYLIDLI